MAVVVEHFEEVVWMRREEVLDEVSHREDGVAFIPQLVRHTTRATCTTQPHFRCVKERQHNC